MTRSRRNTGLWAGFRQRQDGLTMPEIMLGLAMIAIVTAGGVVAFNQVAPRVRVNTIMAGVTPAMIDVTQFIQFSYSPGAAAAAPVSGPTNGWGVGTPAITAAAICPSLEQVACVAPCAWNAGTTTCNSAAPAGNFNYIQFENMATFRREDGGYDTDADLEWFIPIGANDAIEVAFAVQPVANEPFGAGNGDFTRCGTATDHALYMIFAAESDGVCENLWSAVGRLDAVSQSWCEVDFVLPANVDGEAAVLACVPE